MPHTGRRSTVDQYSLLTRSVCAILKILPQYAMLIDASRYLSTTHASTPAGITLTVSLTQSRNSNAGNSYLSLCISLTSWASINCYRYPRRTPSEGSTQTADHDRPNALRPRTRHNTNITEKLEPTGQRHFALVKILPT